METTELRAALEAILFLSSDPVLVDDLAESLEETKEAVSAQLEEIKRLLMLKIDFVPFAPVHFVSARHGTGGGFRPG